jgi:hypothetical protein
MAKNKRLSTEQERDELFEYLKYSKYPESSTKDIKRRIRRSCESLILENDQIKYVKSSNEHLIAIFEYETVKIKSILDEEHKNSHFGIVKMASIIN